MCIRDRSHSVYNQIKRGDIEGVKIGAGTHKRLAGVPFRIISKTTGESHIVVTDKNGQFSTASSWASHKVNTNAGKSSEDGVWSVSYTHLPGVGFNALTEEYVDMVEAGILDPAKVTRSALQNATSVASTLLTTESCVANIKEDTPAMPAGGGAGMGMM